LNAIKETLKLAGQDGSIEVNFEQNNASQKKAVEDFINEILKNTETQRLLKTQISRKILSGKILTPFERQIVQKIIVPYFHNKKMTFDTYKKLTSSNIETQILCMYMIKKLDGILELYAEPDRQNISFNKLLFAAFQVEVASGNIESITNTIIEWALDEPNILGIIFESETHQKNKIARDFLRSMPLHAIDKLISVHSKSAEIAKIALDIPNQELTEKFKIEPNFEISEKFNDVITQIKKKEPSGFSKFFGTSEFKIYDNAVKFKSVEKLLQSKSVFEPINSQAQAIAPVDKVTVPQKNHKVQPSTEQNFSLWNLFNDLVFGEKGKLIAILYNIVNTTNSTSQKRASTSKIIYELNQSHVAGIESTCEEITYNDIDELASDLTKSLTANEAEPETKYKPYLEETKNSYNLNATYLERMQKT
jgi:hypothetical protein